MNTLRDSSEPEIHEDGFETLLSAIPDGLCGLCRHPVAGDNICRPCRVLRLGEDKGAVPRSLFLPTRSNLCQCSSVSVTLQNRVPICESCGCNLIDVRPVYYAVSSHGPDDISTVPVALDSAIARKYTYTPIRQDREIRLAVLHPATMGEPVHCTLVRMNIENLPPFEAVSYTWADERGDSSLCKNILCGPGRRRLAVTSNCENVLRRLRLADLKRLIWIDSVCIDQSNVGERTHQVRWMSRIYSRAFRVLMYLGEASESSKVLFETLNGTARIEEAIMHSKGSFRQLPNGTIVSTRLQVIKGVDELFTRPWFFRTWVIQEAALAKQAVVMCGNDFVPWDSLSILNLNLINQWRDSYGWLEEIRRSTEHLKGVLEHVPPAIRLQLGHTDQSRNLWNLVRDVRTCHASDPRDKIFAILGLVNDTNERPFIPDYSKSVAETFLNFATYLISESKASLLDLILESRSQTRIMELPSWIPDWSVEQASLAVEKGLMPHLFFRDQPDSETDLATFVAQGETVDLLGKEIDTVYCVDVDGGPRGHAIRKIVAGISKQPVEFSQWVVSWWEMACTWWDESDSGSRSMRASFPTLSHMSAGTAFLDDVPYDPRIVKHIKKLFTRIAQCRHLSGPQIPGGHAPCTVCVGPLLASFEALVSMLGTSPGHTLFLSENYIFVGAGPLAMVEGDVVCLLAGLQLPWVLRPHRDGYRLVGECAFFDLGEHCYNCESPSSREWKRMIIY